MALNPVGMSTFHNDTVSRFCFTWRSISCWDLLKIGESVVDDLPSIGANDCVLQLINRRIVSINAQHRCAKNALVSHKLEIFNGFILVDYGACRKKTKICQRTPWMVVVVLCDVTRKLNTSDVTTIITRASSYSTRHSRNISTRNMKLTFGTSTTSKNLELGDERVPIQMYSMDLKWTDEWTRQPYKTPIPAAGYVLHFV